MATSKSSLDSFLGWIAAFLLENGFFAGMVAVFLGDTLESSAFFGTLEPGIVFCFLRVFCGMFAKFLSIKTPEN